MKDGMSLKLLRFGKRRKVVAKVGTLRTMSRRSGGKQALVYSESGKHSRKWHRYIVLKP